MKKTEALRGIVDTCLRMDGEACDLYARFAAAAHKPDVAAFWRRMADTERRHVRFWDGLKQLADDGMLPELVDDPDKVLAELQALHGRASELRERWESSPSEANMLLMAYRMEFSLLHPAVAKFFRFMSTTGAGDTPEASYQLHLGEITGMARSLAAGSPEIDLLGEAVERLWSDNQRLALQSIQDDLTGVLNRRGFFNAIRPLSYLAHRNQYHVAVFMVDIDDFKKVNDTHGHVRGDEVLAGVARLIRGRMRASDIVGRYGGEEFIVFLPEVNHKSIARISDDLRERIAKGMRDPAAVTVSIGAASGRLRVRVDDELNGLIETADECLAVAKRNGKNRVEVAGA